MRNTLAAVALAFLLGAVGGFLGSKATGSTNRFVAQRIDEGPVSRGYSILLTDTATGRMWWAKAQGKDLQRWDWVEAAPPPTD